MKMRKENKINQVHCLKTLLQIKLIKLLHCYESRLKRLSQETTLVLSNTRELDRVPNTK